MRIKAGVNQLQRLQYIHAIMILFSFFLLLQNASPSYPSYGLTFCSKTQSAYQKLCCRFHVFYVREMDSPVPADREKSPSAGRSSSITADRYTTLPGFIPSCNQPWKTAHVEIIPGRGLRFSIFILLIYPSTYLLMA